MIKKILPIVIAILPLYMANAAPIVNVDTGEPPAAAEYIQSAASFSADYIWNNTSNGTTVSNPTFNSNFEVDLNATAGDIDIAGAIQNFGGLVRLRNTGASGDIGVAGTITSHLGDIILSSSGGRVDTMDISLIDDAELLSISGGTGLVAGNVSIASGSGIFNSGGFLRLGNLNITYDFPTGVGDPDPVATTLTATGAISIDNNVSNSGNGGVIMSAGSGITVVGTITNSDGFMTINPGAGQDFISNGMNSDAGGRIIFADGDNFDFGVGGLSAAGDLIVGSVNVGTDGDVYFVDSANIAATGGVSVGGAINVVSGESLHLGGSGAKITSLSAVSLVDIGTFRAYVNGATTFGALDTFSAAITNEFYLDTETLNVPVSAYNNQLNKFDLIVQNGPVTATSIYNGSNLGSGINLKQNENADLNIQSTGITITGNVINAGNELNLIAKDSGNISITGDILNGTTDGSVAIGTNPSAALSADGTLGVNDVNNFGDLTLSGETAANINSILNTGDLFVSSSLSTGSVNVAGIVRNTGNSALAAICTDGTNCDLFMNADDIDIGARFTNDSGTARFAANTGMDIYEVLVSNGNVYLTAPNLTVDTGLYQTDGTLDVQTDNLIISYGGIQSAGDITISNTGGANLLTANITGDVSNGVKFSGVGSMNISGNYYFNGDSQLNVALNDTTHNGTIDETTYYITGGAQIVNVSGNFVTNITSGTGGIGLYLTSIVDPLDTVYLLKSDEIQDLALGTRNLSVTFCNVDGTRCFDYLDAFRADQSLLPVSDALAAYLTTRDTDSDGDEDSIYIVFDPRFGGPVEVFKIQPIVNAESTHTYNEYEAAGALDKLIATGLTNAGFINTTPIEAIPIAFQGTNLEQVANAIYARMEQNRNDNGTDYMARFSGLFQPVEGRQVVAQVDLSERMAYREFEHKVFDEFLLNRTRNLKKIWADVNVGFFDDWNSMTGNRLSVAAGIDWRQNKDTIVGVTGRVTQMSSDNDLNIDLSYGVFSEQGNIQTSVKDTSISIGGYLMSKIDNESRFYANVNYYHHSIDVSRNQTYMAQTNGSTSAESISGEFGLLHDILNQYIVGNVYARVGGNSGFELDMTDYMNIKQNSYLILTPGYTLTAQKRIYATPWLQLKPNLKIGAEYNVLGADEVIEYKFALVDFYTNEYSKYEYGTMNPMWMNLGAGIEILSAGGGQIGFDYKYQTNFDIQSHTIRLGGSYRF